MNQQLSPFRLYIITISWTVAAFYLLEWDVNPIVTVMCVLIAVLHWILTTVYLVAYVERQFQPPRNY